MRFDDLAHDGESEASTPGFRRAQERAERALALLGGHALARVLELNENMGRLGPCASRMQCASGDG